MKTIGIWKPRTIVVVILRHWTSYRKSADGRNKVLFEQLPPPPNNFNFPTKCWVCFFGRCDKYWTVSRRQVWTNKTHEHELVINQENLGWMCKCFRCILLLTFGWYLCELMKCTVWAMTQFEAVVSIERRSLTLFVSTKIMGNECDVSKCQFFHGWKRSCFCLWAISVANWVFHFLHSHQSSIWLTSTLTAYLTRTQP